MSVPQLTHPFKEDHSTLTTMRRLLLLSHFPDSISLLWSNTRTSCPFVYSLPVTFALTPARLKAMRWVWLEARLWISRDQENCTKEEEKCRRTKWKRWYKAEEERTLSFSSLNPLPSPPCLCSLPRHLFFSSWIGVNYQSDQDSGHSILLHTLSHTTSQLLELAARLCMQPVPKPAAAEGISEQELKNHRTIAQSDVLHTHTHVFPPFCHLGTHHVVCGVWK